MPAQPSTQRSEKRRHPAPQTDPRGSAQENRRELDREEIARRAYERYEARGGEHGRDQEDWFNAEQDLKGRGE
jgi:hypothetical protein